MAEPSLSQAAALYRATSGQSLTNYTAIFEGFAAKGIPESEIQPRVNVFTFNAWKALEHRVGKGEHGVKAVTFVDMSKPETDPATGEIKLNSWRRPWTTTVFHVSQTEPVGGES